MWLCIIGHEEHDTFCFFKVLQMFWCSPRPGTMQVVKEVLTSVLYFIHHYTEFYATLFTRFTFLFLSVQRCWSSFMKSTASCIYFGNVILFADGAGWCFLPQLFHIWSNHWRSCSERLSWKRFKNYSSGMQSLI